MIGECGVGGKWAVCAHAAGVLGVCGGGVSKEEGISAVAAQSGEAVVIGLGVIAAVARSGVGCVCACGPVSVVVGVRGVTSASVTNSVIDSR